MEHNTQHSNIEYIDIIHSVLRWAMTITCNVENTAQLGSPWNLIEGLFVVARPESEKNVVAPVA